MPLRLVDRIGNRRAGDNFCKQSVERELPLGKRFVSYELPFVLGWIVGGNHYRDAFNIFVFPRFRRFPHIF